MAQRAGAASLLLFAIYSSLVSLHWTKGRMADYTISLTVMV